MIIYNIYTIYGHVPKIEKTPKKIKIDGYICWSEWVKLFRSIRFRTQSRTLDHPKCVDFPFSAAFSSQKCLIVNNVLNFAIYDGKTWLLTKYDEKFLKASKRNFWGNFQQN